MAAPALVADLEGRLPAVRAAISRAIEALVAALRAFPGCHNYRAGDLNATWWIWRARERERSSIGTERVAQARVELEALVAAEAEITGEINCARHDFASTFRSRMGQ